MQRRDRDLILESCPHRFHDRKIKHLHLLITRYSSRPSKKRKQKVKQAFRSLILRVRWMVGIAEELCQFARLCGSLPLVGLSAELEGFLPAMRQVVSQASRWDEGETVPASALVFSIFKPHTKLIKCGRRNKPIAF